MRAQGPELDFLMARRPLGLNSSSSSTRPGLRPPASCTQVPPSLAYGYDRQPGISPGKSLLPTLCRISQTPFPYASIAAPRSHASCLQSTVIQFAIRVCWCLFLCTVDLRVCALVPLEDKGRLGRCFWGLLLRGGLKRGLNSDGELNWEEMRSFR